LEKPNLVQNLPVDLFRDNFYCCNRIHNGSLDEWKYDIWHSYRSGISGHAVHDDGWLGQRFIDGHLHHSRLSRRRYEHSDTAAFSRGFRKCTLEVDKTQVQFENLTFAFERETVGINNISLTVYPGEKLWVVGASGAG
jgi:ABC-type multidrug transport system fused ATPase/permease subunit